MNTRKQPNRFLAILLGLCMLVLPVEGITAFAAGTETVISSDATWGDQIISNDVRIESDATLTITGAIAVNDTVTITGGGKIVRGSDDAYFQIGRGGSLTIDGVTVDGNGISSIDSMFDVNSATLDLKNSTVQNCVKNTSYGGAINVSGSGAQLTIENTTIQGCSASGYGGAIYLADGAVVTIKSGTFSENKTRSSTYGGGFAYNRVATLTIEGGNFLNNSSAGRGGAIYNAGLADTKTYIRGGVFSGNTSSYSNHMGSGAVFYSSENTADTVLYISGSVQFGDGEERGGQDGLYLDTGSDNTLRKTQISSALQHPIHIYVECEEGRVIAEGVDGYALTAADMTRLQFHDIGSSGTDWYAWLNSASNEVYVSETEPIYVIYDANGATGSVADNHIYASGDEVTVKSTDGLTYEGAIFKGWNTAKDSTGTMYQPGDTFSISATTTLYAQWELAYTVTLPSTQTGYTLTPSTTNPDSIKEGDDYSFTLKIADGYYKTGDFAVKANDVELNETDGVYTISNITENQIVTVEGVAADNVLPTAEIQLGENRWTTFLNEITFGLFFKDTKTVTIVSADPETGVARTEYFVSDTAYQTSDALEGAAGGQWKPYSQSFSINPNSKNIIYVKVTDNAGNVGYASSEGIVLYTDAAQKTQSISFTKTGAADVTAEVTLNENTIDKIYCGQDLLRAETDYTVSGGTITFQASWLNTLSAGEHTLTVHYKPMGVDYVGGNKNEAPDTTTIALKVQRAEGSVEITNDISRIYDGSAVADVAYNSPSKGKATVEYKARDAEDSAYTITKPSAVGKYTVRVTVAADDNYTAASDTADFDITYLKTPSDPFELSGTKGENGWYTSDVTITPPQGYTVSDDLNGAYSDSWTISASAEDVTIYLKNAQDQMTDAIAVGKIQIDKDDPEITAIGDVTSYLQSDTAKITAQDGISGVAKVEVRKDNGSWTDITDTYGSGYTVEENGTYDFRVYDHAGNSKTTSLTYANIDTQQPAVTIEALHDGEAYTDGAWTNQDITLTPKNTAANLGTTTYRYRVDRGEWQDYINPIVICADTDADGVVYEFKAKSASGVESDAVSITVKRDTAAPDGDITIKENSVRQVLNAITFGLFFNEDVDVAITGRDALSGVATIQYHRSTEILAEEELASLAWVDYRSAIHETAEDAEQFVYYVKVTDKAGNVTCFASDGATFDLTAPSITGVTNDLTYYTTQKVTITDANLTSVTLNSAPATLENGVLTLPGDTETTYTITAADRAGNSRTVQVTMKTIASLAEDIDGLTTGNVTSADEETINAVQTAAGNVDIESATDDEKAALQEIMDNCEDLLEKMDETEQEIRDITSDVNGYDTDSVKSSDNVDIETLMDRIDTLLGGGNLTQTEKENLEAVKGTTEALLEKIAATEDELSKVTDSIGGYDEDSIKSADKETVETLVDRIDALLEGGNLTDEEHEALESVRDDAEALLQKIDEIAEAGDTENIQNVQNVTPDNVKLEDKEDLQAAKEDIEQALTDYADNYTEDEKKQFEETLKQIEDALEVIQRVEDVEEAIGGLPQSVGPDDTEAKEQIYAARERYDALSEHEKVLVSEETAEKLETLLAQLEAYRISATPQTGDDSHIVFWIVLMLISGGAVLKLGVKRTSKKGKNQSL